MSLVSWYVARRIRKSLGMSRAEWRKTMVFPKWFGVVSAVVTAAPGLWAAYHSGGWQGLVMAAMALAGGAGVVNSHSLLGTGGKPAQ